MRFTEIPIYYPRFEKEFPGWATLVRTVTEKVLTLKVVQMCLGITKQQIDYWLQKGVLPIEDRATAKWRRFSILDVVMMAIAAKLKSHGIEISDIAHIREIGPLWRSGGWTEGFVHMINGFDVYLYTDFATIAGIIGIDPEENASDLGLLKLRVGKDTSFLTAVSLKKICDALAPKLQLDNFKATVLPDGQYEFVINGVPLRLESLKADDHPSLLDELNLPENERGNER